MEVILCPRCISEIAVEDLKNYDVDCDCGNVLTSKDKIVLLVLGGGK